MITVTNEQFNYLMVSKRLDPYCSSNRQFLGVVDANAILSSVDNDCRKGAHCRSRLLRMATGGSAMLYAADHVYFEVYEHLPRMARYSPVPVAKLRERFETEYLPVLRFVTVDTTSIVDPQVLAITDPDDVPTGQLAKLIPPCVVFSEDRHLRLPGLAPEDWRLVAQFAVDVVEGATGQRVRIDAVTLSINGTVELIKFAGRKTGAPPLLLGGIALAGIAYALKSPERRQVIGKYVMPMIEAHSMQIEQAIAQERRGLEGLREAIIPALTAPTAKQQVAIVLARQQEPLLADEIQQRMLMRFPADSVSTVSEVRQVLTGGSEFIQPERYRWQFGRQAGPWRGRL